MSASRDEKTGKWTAQCYYENWKGEKKHKKKRGFVTKKEALEWEREFLKSTSANMEGVRGQLERMKELCKERNNLYEKQNDLKGQK